MGAFSLLQALIFIPIVSATSYFDEQKVDHNDPKSGVFRQRYIYDDSLVPSGNKASVVLVEVQYGHKDISNFAEDMRETAVAVGAVMIAIAHRYYGGSIPLPRANNQQLAKTLTIDQAIEDLVTFVAFIKRTRKLDNPRFLLWGGSYTGTVAVFARVKHPEVFFGAVGGSPLITFTKEFPKYNENVAAALSDARVGGSKDCSTFVSTAYQLIKKKLNTIEGQEEIEDKLFLMPPGAIDDKPTALNWFSGHAISTLVQYDNPMSQTVDKSIKAACHMIGKRKKEDVLETLSIILNPDHVPMEVSAYPHIINELKDVTNHDPSRYSRFQLCRETANFASCRAGSACPFMQFPPGEDVGALFIRTCQKAFGISEKQIQAAVDELNKRYGGTQLTGASKVLVVKGDLDPFKDLQGIVQRPQDDVTMLNVPTASHTAWMDGKQQTVAIKEARQRIIQTVSRWLK